MTADLVLIANAQDSTITAFHLEDVSLRPAARTVLPGASSTFAVDAETDRVYAAVKSGPGVEEPAILTLALDRATGELNEVSRQRCLDALAYVELTHDGRWLLGASYHGGVGRVWPVADGVLGEPTDEVHFPNLHCVKVSADDSCAYFVSLGDDLIAQYSLQDGRLIPLDPPYAEAPTGCGARHLILDADEHHAYLATEYSGECFRYVRDAEGRLTRAEAVSFVDEAAGLKHSSFGAEPRAEGLIWGADLHLAASGRYLLASERYAGTIATIAVGEDGALGEVVALRPTEPQPRGFVVAPDGRRVIVAGELSTTASLYRVGDDGALAQADQVPTGNGANWVRVVAAR